MVCFNVLMPVIMFHLMLITESCEAICIAQVSIGFHPPLPTFFIAN